MAARKSAKKPRRFLALAWRPSAKPTARRVAAWPNLTKIGAIYLQDSICVIPDTLAQRRELAPVLERIDGGGGRLHVLPLRKLPLGEEQKLLARFGQQSAQDDHEIVENREVNCVEDVEFEHVRRNSTDAEVEEIRMEFDTVCSWLNRAEARDWFGAPTRGEALEWLRRCKSLLEDFDAAKAFELDATDADERAGELPLFPALGDGAAAPIGAPNQT